MSRAKHLIKNIKAIAALSLLFCISACGGSQPTPEQTYTMSDVGQSTTSELVEPEYKRITPHEAENMMSGDVIVLDVRTQEEFDRGHIRNAVLLPYDELRKNARTILADKSQTILVYCQTGRRSETAARISIDMDYMNIFDFGGIADWHGEIVWAATDTIFFNYFGGGLPDDVITPIDFTVMKQINSGLPYFTFRFLGETVQSYGFNSDKTQYRLNVWSNSEMQTIIITDGNGTLIQEISNVGLTDDNCWETTLRFEDWNFDGYLDFALPYIGFHSTAYFLWNSENSLFLRNEELEILGGRNNVTADLENQRLMVSGGRMSQWFTNFYEYIDGEITLVRWEIVRMYVEDTDEDEYPIVTFYLAVYELMDGEMTMTGERELTDFEFGLWWGVALETSWREAYADFILQNGNYHPPFLMLLDVDFDDIPELFFIADGFGANMWAFTILSFSENEIKQIDLDGQVPAGFELYKNRQTGEVRWMNIMEGFGSDFYTYHSEWSWIDFGDFSDITIEHFWGFDMEIRTVNDNSETSDFEAIFYLLNGDERARADYDKIENLQRELFSNYERIETQRVFDFIDEFAVERGWVTANTFEELVAEFLFRWE